MTSNRQPAAIMLALHSTCEGGFTDIVGYAVIW